VGTEAAVTAVWTSIAVLAVVNFVVKAAGPVLLGGRELPRPVLDVIALLAPAILAALVVVGTFSEDDRLRIDAQTAGVAVAGVAFVLRVPMLGAIGLGALTAALLRAL
jgi:branched-subunit amino acid transport protein